MLAQPSIPGSPKRKFTAAPTLKTAKEWFWPVAATYAGGFSMLLPWRTSRSRVPAFNRGAATPPLVPACRDQLVEFFPGDLRVSQNLLRRLARIQHLGGDGERLLRLADLLASLLRSFLHHAQQHDLPLLPSLFSEFIVRLPEFRALRMQQRVHEAEERQLFVVCPPLRIEFLDQPRQVIKFERFAPVALKRALSGVERPVEARAMAFRPPSFFSTAGSSAEVIARLVVR